MKFLLATNTVSAWAKRSSQVVLDRFLSVSPSDICISVLVEHELRFGLALNPAARSGPATLALLQIVQKLPFDSACAQQAATLRAELAKRGEPVGPYDLLIAATAIVHGLTLVTHNTREFAKVPGLLVVDWVA